MLLLLFNDCTVVVGDALAIVQRLYHFVSVAE